MVYGNGISQTAYFDFNSVYIKETDYNNRPANPPRTNALTEYYFDLTKFVTVKVLRQLKKFCNQQVAIFQRLSKI